MRILESLQMVTSQRCTGISPQRAWKVYDARVIRWRLDSSHRAEQLRSLTELRLGVEPRMWGWSRAGRCSSAEGPVRPANAWGG